MAATNHSLFQKYHMAVADDLSVWYYVWIALAGCLFWAGVHGVNALLFARFNAVYQKKELNARVNYLSYSASLVHAPFSTLNAIYCTWFIW